MTDQTSTTEHDLLTTQEAADLLRLSASALRARRVRRDGPPYHKIGGAVRYSRQELIDWLESHRVEPKGQR